MSVKIVHTACPAYQFNSKLDLDRVSSAIDNILINNFHNQDVVLRGIQSGKHKIAKDKLVELITDTGSDYNDLDNCNRVKVSDKRIDLFGLACKIAAPITLSILEGFHKWKPKSLERPQLKVDIWMIYDAHQLANIEYTHGHYGVRANDGYIFRKPENKKDALLGILVID